MDADLKDKLQHYLDGLQKLSNDEVMQKVEKYLDDEGIEIFVDYLEDFYGINDDEELGLLAQIMISGFVVAKEYEQ
jgi:hypothetical protein